jgi:hypothetical protein
MSGIKADRVYIILGDMRYRAYIVLIVVANLAGCITREQASVDSDYNYAQVFSFMRQPKPEVLNSRLERYAKSSGLWTSRERNGEWESEFLASRAWVEEAKIGFVATRTSDSFRRPTVPWWTPTEEAFEAYERPFSSFPPAHLYIEKHSKGESHIHVFMRRH